MSGPRTRRALHRSIQALGIVLLTFASSCSERLHARPLAGKDAPSDSEVPSPEVQAALEESSNGRFAATKKKLAAILASKASQPRERDEAGTELARIEWRIDDKPDDARKRLEALIPGAKKKVRPLLLLSRMERSLLRF